MNLILHISLNVWLVDPDVSRFLGSFHKHKLFSLQYITILKDLETWCEGLPSRCTCSDISEDVVQNHIFFAFGRWSSCLVTACNSDIVVTNIIACWRCGKWSTASFQPYSAHLYCGSWMYIIHINSAIYQSNKVLALPRLKILYVTELPWCECSVPYMQPATPPTPS